MSIATTADELASKTKVYEGTFHRSGIK